MRAAGRTEGPLAPLFYSALLVLSGTATAQTVDVSALETCMKLPTEAARLACFEAIVSGENDVAVMGEPESAESATPAVVVPAAASEAEPVEAQEPPEVAAATGMPAEDFGREHLDSQAGNTPEVLYARVVKVSKGNHDSLVFHLDNGQIWRQIQPRYYPYPRNREFDATITTGMLGEYQLQVEGEGRKVNVRRLE